MIRIKSKIPRLATVITIIIIGTVFSLLSLRKAGELSWHQRLVMAFITPPQKAVRYMGSVISSGWRHYFYLVGVSEENVRLKKLLDEHKVALMQCSENMLENQRLRNLMAMKDRYLSLIHI